VLEGEHGFFHAYSTGARPELLLQDLGERYLMHGITIKAYPTHVSFQAVIEAIQRFHADRPYRAEQIESVRIEGSGRFFEERFGERRPTTIMGAQYSLPWSAALALTRDVADPRAWSEDDLADPGLVQLAGAIELAEEHGRTATADKPAAEIRLTVGGESHTIPVLDWKGSPTSPATFDDMAAKLARYAEPYTSSGRVDALVDRVRRLEDDDDVAGLAAIIRGEGQ
jgi:2-methylcitrate dehydratase PrpD